MNRVLSRFAALCLAVLFLLCAVSCAAGPGDPSDSARPSFVTTVFPLYDFARTVAGEDADVYLLLPPGSEWHTFEPTASDLRRISKADGFFYIGGASEAWCETVLASLGEDAPHAVRLLDRVTPLSAHMHEEDEPLTLEETDEHIWTSPANAAEMVRAIANAAAEADPAHADGYTARADAYLSELDALGKAFSDAAADASVTTVVFGSRFPFRYLFSDLHLNAHAAIDGCGAHTEATPATLAALIETAKTETLPAIAAIRHETLAIANTIAEETHLPVLQLAAGQTVSAEEFEDGITYLSLMRENLAVLKQLLGNAKNGG